MSDTIWYNLQIYLDIRMWSVHAEIVDTVIITLTISKLNEKLYTVL